MSMGSLLGRVQVSRSDHGKSECVCICLTVYLSIAFSSGCFCKDQDNFS